MIRPLALVLALNLPLAAAAAEDPRLAQVDALFSAWNKPGSPGCAVGIMSQGKLVHAKGYGLADIAQNVPLSPDTVFDIASMAKQFTAANVALLTLDRKLALSDDVRARFPELHVDVPITIDELLHHTSGLRDYAELYGLQGVETTDNSSVIALLSRQKALNFAPSTQSAYSNSNYVVLAELIQRASGKSLATLSQERVFGPLKMRSTRYAGALKDDPSNLANSYVPSPDGRFVPLQRNTQSVGDGNLLTTVRDLALWDENFYTNRVGGKSLARMMRTPATLLSGQQVPYGLGLMFDTYRGLATEHHGGSFHGFRTELLRFPDRHFSVSVLCNVAGANASGLASQVADIYLADVLQPLPAASATPVAVKIDPHIFDAYTGEYAFDFGGVRVVIRFARDGERFLAQPSTGESPVELSAASETEFLGTGGKGSRVTFEPEADGSVNRATLHRENRDFVGQRVMAPSAWPDQSDKLAGVYYSAEADATFRLEPVGGRLIVDAGHNRRFPIGQTGENRFVMPGGATLEVERDTAGQITALVYSSSRVANLPFVRQPTPAEP